MLGSVYGSPTPLETFGYVAGALVASGVVLGFVFDRPVVDSSIGRRIPVPSMLHLMATSGAILGAFGLATTLRGVVSQPAAFALGGFQLTLTYNLLLPVETLATRYALDAGVDVAGPDETSGGT